MRNGTYRVFERRYQPISIDESILREGKDIPDGTDYHFVWTMIEGDNGKWYLSPGWHVVNRIGYVLCTQPFDDADMTRDYVY